MVQVACPYCSLPMIDDGGMTGALVMCPRCGGQFQMPTVLSVSPASTVSSGASAPTITASARSTSRRSAPRKDRSIMMVGGLSVIAMLVGATVFLIVRLDGDNGSVSKVTGTRGNDGREKGLVHLIADEENQIRVLIRRSDESRQYGVSSGSTDKVREGYEFARKAEQLVNSRDQHRLELAEYYATTGDKQKAILQLIGADVSQKGRGDLGKQIRSRLTELRGY